MDSTGKLFHRTNTAMRRGDVGAGVEQIAEAGREAIDSAHSGEQEIRGAGIIVPVRSAINSSCRVRPSILVVQTTENRFGHHLRSSAQPIRWIACRQSLLKCIGNGWSEGPMWSAGIVIAGPLTKGSSQMTRVEGDEIVQAFPAYRSNQPFAMCVGGRHANGAISTRGYPNS